MTSIISSQSCGLRPGRDRAGVCVTVPWRDEQTQSEPIPRPQTPGCHFPLGAVRSALPDHVSPLQAAAASESSSVSDCQLLVGSLTPAPLSPASWLGCLQGWRRASASGLASLPILSCHSNLPPSYDLPRLHAPEHHPRLPADMLSRPRAETTSSEQATWVSPGRPTLTTEQRVFSVRGCESRTALPCCPHTTPLTPRSPCVRSTLCLLPSSRCSVP